VLYIPGSFDDPDTDRDITEAVGDGGGREEEEEWTSPSCDCDCDCEDDDPEPDPEPDSDFDTDKSNGGSAGAVDTELDSRRFWWDDAFLSLGSAWTCGGSRLCWACAGIIIGRRYRSFRAL
jgi:hypothetical protein